MKISTCTVGISFTVVSRASAHSRVSAHACTAFQGVTVAASIYTNVWNFDPGNAGQYRFKRQWVLIRDTTVLSIPNLSLRGMQPSQGNLIQAKGRAT